MTTLRKTLAGLALTAMLAAAMPAQAATWTNPTYGAWHSATIGGGGYLQNVVLCPTDPKRVYSYGDMCGAFRSDDGGLTWRMIHGTLPTSAGNYEFSGLLVDPRNADHIMVATGGQWSKEGVYTSNDGGGTWTKTLSATWLGNGPHRAMGFLLARDPKNPDVVLAASLGTGVWRSEDGGKTWADCGAKDLYSADIRFDRAVPNRVYLCAVAATKMKLGGGFFRSDDGGRTWIPVADKSPHEILQDPKDASIFYALFGGSTVMRSVDACATWQPFADGLPTTDDCKFDAIGAGPDFVLVAANNRGAFYRLNAGATTWQPIARIAWDKSDSHIPSAPYGMATSSITVDPRNPDHWFATDFMGIYQTWDGGKTSKPTPRGIEVTVVHAITPDVADPATAFIGMADVGGFWSGDTGSSYTSYNIPMGGANIKMISQSPADPNIVYAVGSNGYGDWTSNQVFVSSDRGKHYLRVPMAGTGFPKGWLTCDSIVADPKDPKTAYVTNSHTIKQDDGGVYKTVDGGKSWTWMGQGLPDGKWYFQSNIWVHGPELAASADGSLIAISNQSHMINRFDPVDKTWKGSPIDSWGTFYSVVADETTSGRYYLGIDTDKGGVFRSDDSGLSWKRVFALSVQFVACDPKVPGRVAAGTRDGVILSTDGGAHWTPLDKSLPYRLYPRVGFVGNRLLAGTSGSGMFWCDLGGVVAAK